jgi:hypothetical protein
MDLEQVLLDHVLRQPLHGDFAGIEQDRTLAECADRVQVVPDEQQRGAAPEDFLDPRHRLRLERGIADRQRLVHDQDIGVGMHLHREREAHRHAGAVGLDGLVDEVADVGEGDDRVHPFAHLLRRQAQDGRVHAHVLAPCQFQVEAGTQFQQRGHATVHAYRAFGRRQHAGDDLQQRALAAAVESDDAQRLASPQAETHAAQRIMAVQAPPRLCVEAPCERRQPAQPPGHPMQQRHPPATRGRRPQQVGLADVSDFQGGRGGFRHPSIVVTGKKKRAARRPPACCNQLSPTA